MHLLKLDSYGEFNLTNDLIDEVPPYAILSHTWGADTERGFLERPSRWSRPEQGWL